MSHCALPNRTDVERRLANHAALTFCYTENLYRKSKFNIDNNDAYQRQRPLRFSIDEWTCWEPQLTQYGELVHLGGPVIIENLLRVDHFATLFRLRPRPTTHIRDVGEPPLRIPYSVRSEDITNIRALRR